MKKLKKYEINDGLDGVILAKSLKQAIKILAPYHGYPVHDFMLSIKKCEKGHCWDGDWCLTNIKQIPKKGRNKRVRMIGWYE
ncbi:hypothetical protein KYB31_09285 [Clostridium felsineum]|uniref:hypothetical protein n=1 Tax=Clostridium felsineum TaxID=36839 RepID=UPI00214D5B65|nr:hypothetical protein [Clostridium felsineum]MCR3759181.1 hypothetical protein [Clostridium felsineum]